LRYSKTLTVTLAISLLFVAAIIASCSTSPTSSPASLSNADLSSTPTSLPRPAIGGPPGYEDAYVNGNTVRINAIEVKQNPTGKAQADLYEVIYPFDPATGTELSGSWPDTPQCDPCDHTGNGDTPDDYHDHVLDSQPSNPGHGEYNALWHVYLIMPNYTNDATHNAAVNDMLNSMLPAKSEAAVDELLATQVDGIPIANEIDTQFYFLCAVVSSNAGSHSGSH